MSRKITIVFAYVNPERLKGIVNHNTICIYAGQDIARYELFNQILNDIIFISSSQFNRFVDDKRDDFVSWMDKIHMIYGHNIGHWITDTFNSNPYSSKLFLYCMNLLFFRSQICDEMNKNKNILFITEDYILMKIAKEIAFSTLGTKVQLVGSFKGLLHLYKKVSKSTLRGLFQILFLTTKYCIAVISRILYGEKRINNVEILLDTFLIEGSFTKDGVFKNKYFTALFEHLNQKGIPIAILPIIIGNKPWQLWSTYKFIRKSNIKFILVEDYIKFSDIVELILFPFRRVIHMEKVIDFQGIDIQALVNEENWLNLLSLSFILNVLLLNMPKHLKNTGLYPKRYINWSENQTLHRAIILGIRKYLPSVYVVGGKPFVPPLNHLNLFNTNSERLWRVAPDKIVTSGEKPKNLFSKYDTNGIYEVGASYRYAYLWDLVKTDFKNLSNTETISLLLPYKRDLAMYMLRLSSSAISNALDKGYNFIIKGHPAYMKSDTLSMIHNAGIKDNRLIIADNDIKNILQLSKAIITSASSVLCEAICLGIPVVLVASPVGLDLNMNTVVANSMWTIADSEKDLDFLLNHWALNHPLSMEQRKKIGKDTLESLFMPNSEEYLKVYLT